jgi:hypothetical protein
MAVYYTYLNEQCKKEAKKLGVLEEVLKIQKDIEKRQSISNFDPHPVPFLKKRFGGNKRLIIEGRLIDDKELGEDIVVVILLRCLVRGDDEYAKVFLHNTMEFKEKNHIDNQVIIDYLRTHHKEIKIKPKSHLKDYEVQLLEPCPKSSMGEEAFLESYEWFERISQEKYQQNLIRYHEIIYEIMDNDECAPRKICKIVHPKKNSIAILYIYYPEYNYTLLLAPLYPDNPKDENDLRRKYAKLEKELPEEDILRESRRAYPALVVLDDEIWRGVEKSDDANLALSPEEERILKSIHEYKATKKFPLFINGRPGSGKSTLLQYLFADQLCRYINISPIEKTNLNPPLFLTYNNDLLERAKTTVRSIFTHGAEHYDMKLEEAEINDLLKQSFFSFRAYLRERLPESIRKKFASRNYIDYNRFKSLWDAHRSKHPEKDVRTISSEIAWHAIRTYIKGMFYGEDEYVDPDYYEHEMNENSRSISVENFEKIYKYVWEGWYEPLCKEKNYWDDQDMARAVLQLSDEDLAQHPAVFCDEAQDFTAVELELIERLSLYSQRTVESYQLINIPFAFAGDPFQTLNPTGFQWERVKAGFYELIRQLDPSKKAKLDINFQELSFNYRSSEEIVKLGNLVHLLRAVLFEFKHLQPQQSWTQIGTATPVWFQKSDVFCQNRIREQKEIPIIVPCEENGEKEYIRNDDFLKSLKDASVLSPARSKGLEYNRVILYGFGDYALKNFPELVSYIEKSKTVDKNTDIRLAWEYFFNQLYVALTRAKKRLFIIDSKEAIERFWQFAIENFYKKHLLKYYNNSIWEQEYLGTIVEGGEHSWNEDRDDPLLLAHDYENRGKSTFDAYLLRLAASNYERAGRPEKAKICTAEAYLYDGEFSKAADNFKALGNPERAVTAYWLQGDYESILKLGENYSTIVDNVFHDAARLAMKSINFTTLRRFIERINSNTFEMGGLPYLHELLLNRWEKFFIKLVDRVIEYLRAKHDINTMEWMDLIDGLIKFLKIHEFDQACCAQIAELYYLTDRPKEALALNKECFDEKDSKKRIPWILEALAQTEPFPTNIQYYLELGKQKKALKIWEDNDLRVITGLVIDKLLKASIEAKHMKGIKKLLPMISDMDLIEILLEQMSEKIIENFMGELPIAIAHALEMRREWENLLMFFKKGVCKHTTIDKFMNRFMIVEDRTIRMAAVVRILARSDRLSNESEKIQNKIAEFLKKHLIIEKNAPFEKQKNVKKLFEYIDIQEAGAAFERAFKLTYALDFYEQFFREGYLSYRVLRPSEEESEFARQRWLKCKFRLAEIGGSKSGTGQKHLDEARKYERQWGIDVENIPELPELDVLTGFEYEFEIGEIGLTQKTKSTVFTSKISEKSIKNEFTKPNETKKTIVENYMTKKDVQIPSLSKILESSSVVSSSHKANLKKLSKEEKHTIKVAVTNNKKDTKNIEKQEVQYKNDMNIDKKISGEKPSINISSIVALRFKYGNKKFNIKAVINKGKLIIEDEENDSVQCRKERVESLDIDIIQNENRFMITDWNLNIYILETKESYIYRFLDLNEQPIFGYELFKNLNNVK